MVNKRVKELELECSFSSFKQTHQLITPKYKTWGKYRIWANISVNHFLNQRHRKLKKIENFKNCFKFGKKINPKLMILVGHSKTSDVIKWALFRVGSCRYGLFPQGLV